MALCSQVAFGRGHKFGDAKAVQAELSPLVLPFAPAAARADEKSIPFMTTGDGVGSRVLIAEVDSQLSGRMMARQQPAAVNVTDPATYCSAPRSTACARRPPACASLEAFTLNPDCSCTIASDVASTCQNTFKGRWPLLGPRLHGVAVAGFRE